MLRAGKGKGNRRPAAARLGLGTPVGLAAGRRQWRNRLYDIRQAENHLGCRPRVALDRGQRAAADWYRARGMLSAVPALAAVAL